MDGTANASITNVNARAAAYMIFGGAGGNIPNMDGLYTVAETTTGLEIPNASPGLLERSVNLIL